MTSAPDCLVIHAHPDPDSFNATLRDVAVRALERGGHRVAVIDLYGQGYRPDMSADEHRDYFSIGADHPDPITASHIRLLSTARTLVFVYPTWWAGLPAMLKGWLDRTLLPEVAFHLKAGPDGKEVVRPGLDQVTRLVGITTYGSDRNDVRLLGDAGRRTISRTVRMVCARRCRTTWLGMHRLDTSTTEERAEFMEQVYRTLWELR